MSHRQKNNPEMDKKTDEIGDRQKKCNGGTVVKNYYFCQTCKYAEII
jgi:hypothetical protein